MDLRSALYSMTTCLVPLQFFIVAKVEFFHQGFLIGTVLLLNWLVLILVKLKVMPNLCLMMGISPTLFTFSSICLLTSVWSWCVIPETRGLTLTQVMQVSESIGEMQKRAIFHTFVESEAMYFIFRYLWPFLEGRKRQKSERLRCVDSSATKQQTRFKILLKIPSLWIVLKFCSKFWPSLNHFPPGWS